jgi:hypothetical protein
MKWLLALLLSATAFADTSAGRPDPAKGVIVAAEDARRCFPGEQKFVTPSASDVERLEAGLARALKKIAADDGTARDVLERIDKDARWYVGTKRSIFVQGSCDGLGKHPSKCPPAVDDGGSCDWRIVFDLKRGTFERFATNNPL